MKGLAVEACPFVGWCASGLGGFMIRSGRGSRLWEAPKGSTSGRRTWTRGPEPFVKGKLDVLTSEGADTRAKADQKPACWIDLTGPVADGSSDYVGAVMCDHPANPRFPNVVRIHPTLLPFFSFVPAHREDLRLEAGKPVTWRYRTMVHDGRPDRARNEALFADFSSPVDVQVRD